MPKNELLDLNLTHDVLLSANYKKKEQQQHQLRIVVGEAT